MAIALTWDDVTVYRDGERVIRFNKAYTHGVLKDSKTGRETIYPVYPALMNLLFTLSRTHDDLVFPSQEGGYINLQNFTRRYWRTVVQGLVDCGEIDRYLPTYHCRHSTATFLAQAGVSTQAIAALLDTSEEMLNKHYWDNKELTNISIPDLLSAKIKTTISKG